MTNDLCLGVLGICWGSKYLLKRCLDVYGIKSWKHLNINPDPGRNDAIWRLRIFFDSFVGFLTQHQKKWFTVRLFQPPEEQIWNFHACMNLCELSGCWTKNRGKTPKMDGENNRKPYWNGWFGGTTIFGNIQVNNPKFGALRCLRV